MLINKFNIMKPEFFDDIEQDDLNNSKSSRDENNWEELFKVEEISDDRFRSFRERQNHCDVIYEYVDNLRHDNENTQEPMYEANVYNPQKGGLNWSKQIHIEEEYDNTPVKKIIVYLESSNGEDFFIYIPKTIENISIRINEVTRFHNFTLFFDVDSDNKQFSSENGSLYNKDKTHLYRFFTKDNADINLADSTVTSISHSAFGGVECASIVLPTKLKELDFRIFESCKIDKLDCPGEITCICGTPSFSKYCHNNSDIVIRTNNRIEEIEFDEESKEKLGDAASRYNLITKAPQPTYSESLAGFIQLSSVIGEPIIGYRHYWNRQGMCVRLHKDTLPILINVNSGISLVTNSSSEHELLSGKIKLDAHLPIVVEPYEITNAYTPVMGSIVTVVSLNKENALSYVVYESYEEVKSLLIQALRASKK